MTTNYIHFLIIHSLSLDFGSSFLSLYSSLLFLSSSMSSYSFELIIYLTIFVLLSISKLIYDTILYLEGPLGCLWPPLLLLSSFFDIYLLP